MYKSFALVHWLCMVRCPCLPVAMLFAGSVHHIDTELIQDLCLDAKGAFDLSSTTLSQRNQKEHLLHKPCVCYMRKLNWPAVAAIGMI